MVVWDNPFGQVIDLLEAITPCDRQRAGTPQPFQRGFGRVPIPPTAFAARLTHADIGAGDGAFVGNAAQDFVEFRLVSIPEPVAPVVGQAMGVTRKAVLPMGEQGHGQDGGIMRPVFKQGAVAFQEGFQVFGFIGWAAGKQNHVMGAFNGGDAINLHETNLLNQGGEISAFEKPEALKCTFYLSELKTLLNSILDIYYPNDTILSADERVEVMQHFLLWWDATLLKQQAAASRNKIPQGVSPHTDRVSFRTFSTWFLLMSEALIVAHTAVRAEPEAPPRPLPDLTSVEVLPPAVVSDSWGGLFNLFY